MRAERESDQLYENRKNIRDGADAQRFKAAGTPREEVRQGAGVGSGRRADPDRRMRSGASAAQVCFRSEDAAFAVFRAANNLFCSGGSAVGIFCVLLLPPAATTHSAEPSWKQFTRRCARLRIQILGGHNGDDRKCGKTGRNGHGNRTDSAGAGKRDWKRNSRTDIVMTKWIGLEGTGSAGKTQRKRTAGALPVCAGQSGSGICRLSVCGG